MISFQGLFLSDVNTSKLQNFVIIVESQISKQILVLLKDIRS